MKKEKSIFANQSWWKRRSRLEKTLIILFVIFIGTFAAFIALVTIKYILPPQRCNTAGCLVAASQIINSIDPSVDPCDDFFKFACGTFIERIHGDNEATFIKEQQEEVERQVAELIKEPIKEDDHPFVKIQKEIFQNCMNETEEEQEDALHSFNETLMELHGWPVVDGFAWNEQLFDWEDTVFRLRRKGLPYEMILDLTVMPDFANKTRNAIYITAPYIIRVNQEQREYYKQYMVEVAVALGAEKNLAIIEMEKVFDLMERMKKVVEINDPKNETETISDVKADMLTRRFTVGEYQKQHDDIQWLTYINNILKPVSKISKSDYVYFPRDEFVDALFTLLDKTPRRIQANYIIWNVVDNVITYLSKKLQQIESNYLCLSSKSPSPKDKFKYCKRVINRSFHPSPVYINYARKYLPSNKRQKVQELLRNVKAEFVELLNESTWLDLESKEKALEKANSITEVIGTPGDYFNDAIYDKFDSGPRFSEDIDKTNFFHILRANSKHQNDLAFAQINKVNDDTHKEIPYHFVIATVNAMYSPVDNAMVLPVAILQGIFYNPDRPQYLNYGSLGSIIGHEITHGFCKDASTYDKNGNEIDSMWSNETVAAFDEQVQCIINDAENFDVEDTEATINGTLTLEENIADYTGVKVAYAAYKKWVSENGEEPQLTGVDYTPSQLFWISSISHECYQLSGKKLEQSLKWDSHALNVFRAVAPIRNSPEFAKDFNCPVNSNMNPAEKCQIF